MILAILFRSQRIASMHLISHQLNLVSWVLLGLTTVCSDVPFRNVRLRRFIVHGLSESLERRRGICSITPGLGGKVFAQFLFYRFEFGSIQCATDRKDLVFQPDGWCSVFCHNRSCCGRLSRCWPPRTAMMISHHLLFNNFDKTVIYNA